MLLAGRTAKDAFAYILEEDPDLAEGLPPGIRHYLTKLLRAPVIVVDSRRWSAPTGAPKHALGLLVLDGVLGQRIRLGNAVATELLMCGDILRPWDRPAPQNPLPAEADWRVFAPARVAYLDQHATALIGRRPELITAFTGRLLRRSRNAQYMLAISHLSRVEDRLRSLLWHIAGSCGHVTPQGLRIPFRLTHAELGEIVGARRPSVTTGLKKLEYGGELIRCPEAGYVLTGDPAVLLSGLSGQLTASATGD